METLGIALYLIGGVVAAPVFCYVLVKLVRPHKAIASWLFTSAVTMVLLFAVELIMVSIRGVLGTRALIGPAFFPLHALLTLGLAPACACALLLGRRSIARWWPVAAALCWFIGAAAIFYQYDVAETLYGIDGIGGPYT
jgi:hypothetical protein